MLSRLPGTGFYFTYCGTPTEAILRFKFLEFHQIQTGEEKTIVFGLTGTGYFDMFAYGRYNDGEMSDYIPTDAELQAGFDGIPKI